MRMVNTMSALALSLAVAAAHPSTALSQDVAFRQLVQTLKPAVICLSRSQIARAAQMITYSREKLSPEDVAGRINAEYGDNLCVAAQIQFREIAAAELVSDGRFAHRLRHIEIVAVYSPVSREWTEFPIRYRSYTLTMWRLRVKTI